MVQSIELVILDKKNIIIQLPIEQLLEKIDLKETYEIMSPNQSSVNMAKLIASLFSIST